MSKIKDLYAEVNDIDDLKPVDDREVWENIRKHDMSEKVIAQILEKEKHHNAQDVEDWLYERAEFEYGQDDEGHTELYFENFMDVCEEAATDLLDGYIVEQHLDLDDHQYTYIIEVLRDELADMWADIECDCIQRSIQDEKDEQELRQSFYNDRNLGIKKGE